MSRGWIKYFTDNTLQSGDDTLISAHLSSWSLGRLQDISSVKVYNNEWEVLVQIQDTEWHQFDRLAVAFNKGKKQPVLLYRVIQALIKPNVIGKYLIINYKDRLANISISNFPDSKKNPVIMPCHSNTWLTVILRDGHKPLLTFAPKGKINGN